MKSDTKVEEPFIRKEFLRQLLNEIMCFQKSHFQMGRLIGKRLIFERQAVHHKFSANKTAMQQSDIVLTPQLYATSLTVTQ